MKKGIRKMRIWAVIFTLILTFSVVLAEPGGTDDPLVTKSYIESVLIPQIKDYVENKISEVNSGGQVTPQSAFKVVEMKTNQEMICDAGAELILRMGKAEIIATQKGGLADTTEGFDLANGTDMPANHLLIVPVSDGRGLRAKSDIIVMVKGSYEIK